MHIKRHPLSHKLNFDKQVYDTELKKQFSVTLIDTADFSPNMTGKEKRDHIRKLEGEWQYRLKTMNSEGALNKRDEKSLSAKRT